jgi:hypothetical protein
MRDLGSPLSDRVLRGLLVVLVVARLPGLFWGLPNVDGWDDDGIAPRDVLSGVVDTYSPGQFYIYPPLQLLLLTVLTLPFTLWRLTKVAAWNPEGLVRAFVDPTTMTVYAVVARALAIVFAALTVLALYDGVERLAGRYAARASAIFAIGHATFTYYGQTSNLDGPLLFWCTLSWRELVRVALGDRSRWLPAALATAAALATKDQGYAVLAFPLVATALHAVLVAPASERPATLVAIARAGIVALVALLLIDGALFNPSGFLARLKTLGGSASQDFHDYVPGLRGTLAIATDALENLPRFMPTEVVVLAAFGVVLAVVRRRSLERGAFPSLLAPLASLSFLVLFNFVARRTQERFLLAPTFFLVVPAAQAVGFLVHGRPRLTRLASIALAVVAMRGTKLVAGVGLSMLHDPRASVEEHLAMYGTPGDRVEVYGNNVYLPRMPDGFRGERVAPTPADKRPFVPSLREVSDAYENLEARSPEWVVVPYAWAWQWLDNALDERSGRMTTPLQKRRLHLVETQRFFRELVAGSRGYDVVDTGRGAGFWKDTDMHNSLNRRVYLLRRRDARSQ